MIRSTDDSGEALQDYKLVGDDALDSRSRSPLDIHSPAGLLAGRRESEGIHLYPALETECSLPEGRPSKTPTIDQVLRLFENQNKRAL